jgi:hypothetical protein
VTTQTRLTLVGRTVDAEALRELRGSYATVVSSNRDSVRASWRFGQRLDSYSDQYSRAQLADAVQLSVSTIQRYLRLYRAYQRPELAEQAAQQLETFNIDLITELQNQLGPIGHARPAGGRRYRYRCHHCQSTEVGREEITDPAELAELNRADQAAGE